MIQITLIGGEITIHENITDEGYAARIWYWETKVRADFMDLERIGWEMKW